VEFVILVELYKNHPEEKKEGGEEGGQGMRTEFLNVCSQIGIPDPFADSICSLKTKILFENKQGQKERRAKLAQQVSNKISTFFVQCHVRLL
jgi:hypothetical protein